MASPPGGPAPHPAFQPTQDYVQMGMTAGLSFICGSVVVGAVALSMGNKRLYDSLFKTRMIAVATTMGFYAGATNWLPAPALLSHIMGRQPRPMPEVMPLIPGRGASLPQKPPPS